MKWLARRNHSIKCVWKLCASAECVAISWDREKAVNALSVPIVVIYILIVLYLPTEIATTRSPFLTRLSVAEYLEKIESSKNKQNILMLINAAPHFNTLLKVRWCTTYILWICLVHNIQWILIHACEFSSLESKMFNWKGVNVRQMCLGCSDYSGSLLLFIIKVKKKNNNNCCALEDVPGVSRIEKKFPLVDFLLCIVVVSASSSVVWADRRSQFAPDSSERHNDFNFLTFAINDYIRRRMKEKGKKWIRKIKKSSNLISMKIVCIK